MIHLERPEKPHGLGSLVGPVDDESLHFNVLR
jgi:hypothetical protein